MAGNKRRHRTPRGWRWRTAGSALLQYVYDDY
jgi:hypothetical protein